MLKKALFHLTAMTVCLLQAGSAIAAPAELQLRWVDLAGRIGGRQISLDLPDGSHLKGHVIAVRTDSLEMEVSGNKRSIPRASVQINGNDIGDPWLNELEPTTWPALLTPESPDMSLPGRAPTLKAVLVLVSRT